MPESLLPRASTTLKGAQKFLGIGVYGGLEKRVENNEKKITSLKNIIKLRKVNVDKLLPASSDGEDKDQTIRTNNLADRLDNIAQSLGVLTRALKHQFNLDKKAADQSRRDENEAQKKDRERNLESRGGKFVSGVTGAITKPFKGFFASLIDFFKNILLGGGLLALINWLKDEDNQAKIKAFWDFLTTTLPELIEKIIEGSKTIGDRIAALLPMFGKAIIETFNAGKRTGESFKRWWRNFRKPPSKTPKQLELDLDPKKTQKKTKTKTIKLNQGQKRNLLKEAGRFILGTGKTVVKSGILMVIADLVFPEGVGQYQDMTGPQAVFNNPTLSMDDLHIVLQSMYPEIATNVVELERIGMEPDIIEKYKKYLELKSPSKSNINLNQSSPLKLSSNQNLKSTNIGAPIASNRTQVINMGDGGTTAVATNSSQGGNDLNWFSSFVVDTSTIASASTLGAINGLS